MRVFLIGDYKTGTGPANVTRAYMENMPGIIVQKMNGKMLRAAELLIKVPFSDVLLLSGHSKQNLLALKLAGLFNKRTAFLMHGCVEHENAINGVPDEDMNRTERQTLKECDEIYAVSDRFADWLKNAYPEYKEKILSQPNGLDFDTLLRMKGKETSRITGQILSIGGGMPRKRIRVICKAVEILKAQEEYKDLKLVVIGDKGLDTEKINSYPFVDNRGIVSREETEKLFRESSLFIQNSCFETFGLAPVEALTYGCPVLLSDKIGALGIIPGVKESDIINDCEDAEEIAEKIKLCLMESNAGRLLDSIDTEQTSWESRARGLMAKLGRLAGRDQADN